MDASNHLGLRLLDAAGQYSGRLALSVAGSAYTYADLYAFAALLARGFADAEGRYCALIGGRRFPTLAGLVAALCYGRVYVPIEEDDPADHIAILDHAGALGLLLVGAPMSRQLRPILERATRPMTVVLADHRDKPVWAGRYPRHRIWSLHELPRLPEARLNSDNPHAYLLFTSGSTGRPKGVLVSHANAACYVANTMELYRPTPADRFSQLAPLGFDFSVHDLLVPWCVGASTHVCDTTNGIGLQRFIRDARLTFWASVPSTVSFMQRSGQLQMAAFPSLRQTLFCGEPLREAIAGAWHRAAPHSRIDNLYGPTEATVAVCGFEWSPGGDGESIVPIGRPYRGTRISVGRPRDAAAHDGAEERIGELWISGTQLVQGYWSGTSTHGHAFETIMGQPWYRTGDLVTLDDRGFLHFAGRRDGQLKVRGQRLERLDVEARLRRLLGVAEVAVVGWPVLAENSVEGLAFFVDGDARDRRDAWKRCTRGLPQAMWPNRIVLGEIPRTRNGKTDYRRLQEWLEAHPHRNGR
ncbi:AMP-binding protein [Thiomonas sp.]|uniref:AMP-binding protein n=1 Tax=Thiomonas sp. TaxID=2047785 RepID=UPI00262EA755|nr:AMP-binding protein [Thiomonas sp.]